MFHGENTDERRGRRLGGTARAQVFAGFCVADSRLVSVELMMKHDYDGEAGRHLHIISPW